jgi:hypothetical protein
LGLKPWGNQGFIGGDDGEKFLLGGIDAGELMGELVLPFMDTFTD